MPDKRTDDETRDRLKQIQRGYVYTVRGVLLAIVILTVFQVFAFVLLRDQQQDLVRVERDNYESSRAAKMQTCKDLNAQRASIRFVLEQSAQNPDPGEERQDRRERLQGFIDRFEEVDCEERVNELFGDGPPR